jgi:Na+/H+ antiporter NhaD/arsenite permease-like protein
VTATLLLLLLAPGARAAEGHAFAAALPAWSVVPFAALLLSIAVLPLAAPHFWESNVRKLLVAAACSVPVLALVGWHVATRTTGPEALGQLEHAVREYLSFIALLGSLYVIAGGIFLGGDLKATPAVNTAFLAVGAVLANLVGTTGAAMVLIRPVLRTNAERRNTRHIPVFFIFVVANLGGMLTPIGDPPLFLGYLRGVPFLWPLLHAWPAWLLGVSLVLVAFFALDTRSYRRETPEARAVDRIRVEPLGLEGWGNLFLMAGVVASVLLLSPVEGVHDAREWHLREIAMVALAGMSLAATPRAIRLRNAFSFGPILEVAALFAGIFVTMVPAALLLELHGNEMGLHAPWHFFWATGALSSFLDNAPTYVTFVSTACGALGPDVCESATRLGTMAASAEGARILLAISVGAVFMGANTYIGNGPNFMVRAIAEEAGVQMPSFFGYMLWSLAVLFPVYALVTLIFFRG